MNDNLSFVHLSHTEKACPVCRDEDYTVVKGECVQWKQEIHYILTRIIVSAFMFVSANRHDMTTGCHLASF